MGIHLASWMLVGLLAPSLLRVGKDEARSVCRVSPSLRRCGGPERWLTNVFMRVRLQNKVSDVPLAVVLGRSQPLDQRPCLVVAGCDESPQGSTPKEGKGSPPPTRLCGHADPGIMPGRGPDGWEAAVECSRSRQDGQQSRELGAQHDCPEAYVWEGGQTLTEG